MLLLVLSVCLLANIHDIIDSKLAEFVNFNMKCDIFDTRFINRRKNVQNFIKHNYFKHFTKSFVNSLCYK